MNARSPKCVWTMAVLVACLATPLIARIGSPVRLSMGSADALRTGEPITVIAVMESGAAVPHASFEVQSAEGWQVLDGETRWAGSMDKGQVRELRFRAVPLSQEPGELPAVVTVLGQEPFTATLDPQRLGGQFPERGRDDAWDPQKGDRAARQSSSDEERIEAVYEPGVALPEPMAATAPRIPGKPAAEPETVSPNRKNQQRAASVVATGRFTYLDDTNARRGVRNATVEILNKNDFPFPDELCGRGITDGNGNFSIGGSCGDLFDGPDLFARIILNNSVVEVKPDSVFSGSYTFDSARRNNSAGGAVNFGTITITTNRGAYHVHNVVMRAHQFMAAAPVNESLSKVTVNFPGSGAFYSPFFDSITLRSSHAFGDEGVVYHEYGHHILGTRAESPAPDYDNGHCDTPTPGHCLYEPEKGAIAWTEGWPNFFAAFLHARHNAADGYGDTMMRFETRAVAFDFPGEEDKTEGIIAEILWDLVDAANDDTRERGDGRRDATTLTFGDVWDVIRTFDPSTDLFHNHPTSIHELYTGLRQAHLSEINNIASTYREAGIVKPQPDIEVSSVQNPPTQLVRGASFSNTNTVRNDGNERANASFQVSLRLFHPASGAITRLTGGTRTVASNFAAGASSTVNTTLTVPATTPIGTHLLQVCADSNGDVPESNESNNCRTAATPLQIQ